MHGRSLSCIFLIFSKFFVSEYLSRLISYPQPSTLNPQPSILNPRIVTERFTKGEFYGCWFARAFDALKKYLGLGILAAQIHQPLLHTIAAVFFYIAWQGLLVVIKQHLANFIPCQWAIFFASPIGFNLARKVGASE